MNSGKLAFHKLCASLFSSRTESEILCLRPAPCGFWPRSLASKIFSFASSRSWCPWRVRNFRERRSSSLPTAAERKIVNLFVRNFFYCLPLVVQAQDDARGWRRVLSEHEELSGDVSCSTRRRANGSSRAKTSCFGRKRESAGWSRRRRRAFSGLNWSLIPRRPANFRWKSRRTAVWWPESWIVRSK